MTTPIIKIKVLPKSIIKGKMDVRFPARVVAQSPILLDKSGGIYTFSFDPTAIGPAGFDALSPTTTRGDIIYRNAVTNTRLPAGTSGYHLQTNGAGADPAWVGFLQAGAGAVTRTWQDKARDFVSVKDFGAVGDGVANDYAAIVAADTAASSLGKAVFFPAGTYNIGANTFTPSVAARLVGEKYTSTVIRSTSATADLIALANGFETVENLQFAATVARTGGAYINITNGACHLRDLYFGSPYRGVILGAAASTVLLEALTFSSPVTTTGVGIEVFGGLEIQIRNVEVGGSGHQAGVVVHACGDITLVDCNFLGGVQNLYLVPGSSSAILSILSIGCWYDQAIGNNILMSATSGGTIARCAFHGGWASGGGTVSTAGFNLAAGSGFIDGITITGMDLFGANYGIAADGATNLVISNNKIAGNSIYGILLTNVNGAVLTGNKIGTTGGFGVNANGLGIAGTSDNISVCGNDLAGNTIATSVTTSGLNISWAGNIGTSGWRSFTPTVAPGTGSITTVGTVSGSYLLSGKTVWWNVKLNITTNGTGGQDLRVTNMPFAPVRDSLGTGREVALTGVMLQADAIAASSLVIITKPDNTYPASSGCSIVANGFYERA